MEIKLFGFTITARRDPPVLPVPLLFGPARIALKKGWTAETAEQLANRYEQKGNYRAAKFVREVIPAMVYIESCRELEMSPKANTP